MKIEIDGRNLRVFGCNEQTYKNLRGDFNWDKSLHCFNVRMTVSNLNLLMQNVEAWPDWLEAKRRRLLYEERLVQIMKFDDDPKPIVEYPVKKKLFKHQIRGANMALMTFGLLNFGAGYIPPAKGQGKGYGLLYEMGCGKTLTAIAVMGALKQGGIIKKVLILAPTSVVKVWPEELESSLTIPYFVTAATGTKNKRLEAIRSINKRSDDDLNVLVINYESAWRDEIYEALQDYDADMIICDESQRIKSVKAEQSKAMHRLGDMARYKMILTGTPVQKDITDLFSQYRFLDSSVFGTNFYAFRNKYANMGGFGNKQIIGVKNQAELVQKEHSIAYRVTKEECLDLPEQTFIKRIVQLEDDAQRKYNELRRESYLELANGDGVTADTILTKLIRLQQLCGGFLTTDQGDNPVMVSNAKLDALMELLEDVIAEKKKAVVFARFTAEMRLIEAALKKANIDYEMIDGSVPLDSKTTQTGEYVRSRAERVQRFQNDNKCKVFLAQIQTAGLGITLHAASIAIYYSLDWNYASYEQSTARIHRIGQKYPCTYINLVCEGTVDEKIIKALDKKENLARTIVDEWKQYFE